MRRLFLASLLALAACAGSGRPEPVARAVFFGPQDAALDQSARETVADVAALARRDPGTGLRLTGYAGTGTTDFPGGNVALGRARAEAVATALRQAGVAAGRIAVAPLGELPAAWSPVEARRVEIRLGG